MKIYLPFANVGKNVLVLSEPDLGHQRNCCLTILETIAGKGKGWQWHPGVNMWYGSEYLLGYIAYLTNEEWAQQSAMSAGEERKAFNGLVKKYHDEMANLGFDIKQITKPPDVMPWWWGNKRFHEGERSMLVRHNMEWYRQFFPNDPNDLCEWWPRMHQDEWVYGPHISPNGDYADYYIDDIPILKPVRSMDAKQFAHHANVFHNLLGKENKTPIDSKEAILDSLKALHDRYHQKRTYQTHEHLS